jgi:hypothetical protein
MDIRCCAKKGVIKLKSMRLASPFEQDNKFVAGNIRVAQDASQSTGLAHPYLCASAQRPGGDPRHATFADGFLIAFA